MTSDSDQNLASAVARELFGWEIHHKRWLGPQCPEMHSVESWAIACFTPDGSDLILRRLEEMGFTWQIASTGLTTIETAYVGPLEVRIGSPDNRLWVCKVGPLDQRHHLIAECALEAVRKMKGNES